ILDEHLAVAGARNALASEVRVALLRQQIDNCLLQLGFVETHRVLPSSMTTVSVKPGPIVPASPSSAKHSLCLLLRRKAVRLARRQCCKDQDSRWGGGHTRAYAPHPASSG